MTDFLTIRPAPTSIAERLSTINSRLSTFDFPTIKLTGRAGQSREKWQKIARKITENSPDFRPGCCAGAVAAVGLPSPAFLYPRRLALCGRLCAPLWGVLAAGCIGDSTPARGGSVGRLWAFPAVLFPGLWIACACAPLWAALWLVSGLACVPVPLPGCVALCALCGGCGRGYMVQLAPGAALSTCAPLSRGCGSCALSIVPAWPVEGQRKARASCTSSTRTQKNHRRDCTRGGSVVLFIHFQQFGQDSERNNQKHQKNEHF